MTKHIYWCDRLSRDQIISTLRNHCMIVGTSDTVLGLLCDVSLDSMSLLNEIKGRDKKPYIILIESFKRAFDFVASEQLVSVEKLLHVCWPGPLTVIMKARCDMPYWMQSEQSTIALRSPAHVGLQSILPYFKGLFSTSANLSGKPVPTRIQDIDSTILHAATYLVTESSDIDIFQGQASTILDCTHPQKIKLIREGAYPVTDIEKIYGMSITK